MQRPLTILLPVRNAQSTLADLVVRVLDMAAEISERFEILIIDDASTDATSEVAYDLCRRYPQIRALRHRKPLGEDASVRLLSVQTRGEVVRVRCGQHPVFESIFATGNNDAGPPIAEHVRTPAKAGPAASKLPPARPNFLDRARAFAREGL